MEGGGRGMGFVLDSFGDDVMEDMPGNWRVGLAERERGGGMESELAREPPCVQKWASAWSVTA